MQCPLLTASTSTFESLAMLLPDVSPSAAQRAAPIARGVRVAFTGPFSGALAVHVSEDVAHALVESMLGHDVAGESGERVLGDALGEVANVICGNLLPELAGRAAVFHLAAPRPVALASDAPLGAPGDADDRPSLAVTLGVERGRVDVTLHVDPHPAELDVVRACSLTGESAVAAS